jgi:hypothetical protein
MDDITIAITMTIVASASGRGGLNSRWIVRIVHLVVMAAMVVRIESQ